MTPMMYAVTGNTHKEGYGASICLFMITDDLAIAERHSDYILATQGIRTKITEVGLSVGTKAYLGGYVE